MTFPILVKPDVARTNGGRIKDLYKCGCGTEFTSCRSDVKSGHTNSCGCYRVKRIKQVNTKHGHTLNYSASDTYSSWRGMVERCINPKHKSYPRYGGRGIAVCDSWRNSFDVFLFDMGERPPRTSIDRIDNNKGYYKENCRWATFSEQRKNQNPRKKKSDVKN